MSLFAVSALLALLAAAPARARELTYELGPVRVRGLVHSMEGPSASLPVASDRTEWIRRIRIEVRDEKDGGRPAPRFLCHANLIFADGTEPGSSRARRRAFAVLAPGGDDIRFPRGYGLPMKAGRRFVAHFMALSHDARADADLRARIVLDTQEKPLKPLVLVVRSVFAADAGLPRAEPSFRRMPDTGDKTWMIPPGRRTLSHAFRFPFSGRIHYISGHLHRYGLWLALVEKRSGRVLWRSETVRTPDGYFSSLPPYSGERGLRVEADRAYVLEAGYDNASSSAAAAMAQIYMYASRGER
ncbi:MAG: hypothetical protein KGM24_14935 [Elusimicrobia bacterium]|nr:hypothetical protein [Elusimicrobiota bacterium]